MEFPSCVDDLHCGHYLGWRRVGSLDAIGRKEQMADLMDRVSRTIKEVAGERVVSLAEDMDE